MRSEAISSPLVDSQGRALRDLRVSVTDRCNFRCRYCMPKEQFDKFGFLPRHELLTFEEIAQLVSALKPLGLRKVRLTGGEPLLRAELPVLVRLLRGIPDLEIALTTNGALLSQQARPLAAAGLHRITVSLDTLDDTLFQRITDARHPVSRVLEGLAEAERAGFASIKLNCVVRRGVNDGESLLELVRRFRGTPHVLRFIEYMDVGNTNGWRKEDVVSEEQILAAVSRVFPLELVAPACAGEVARRYRFRDGQGEIGVIASVTRPFCGGCTRLRLSSDGKLFTCLFSKCGHDVRTRLRSGADAEALRAFVRSLWQSRSDRYSELRAAPGAEPERPEMSYLGG